MELNRYDIEAYEQVLHSIGIDVVDRTAVVLTSSIDYFDDVSMIPMSERRLMGMR